MIRENKLEREQSSPEYSDDYIVCLICGNEFKTLNTHIRFKHDMTVSEYKEEFNVQFVSSNAIRLHRSNQTRKRYKSKNIDPFKAWDYDGIIAELRRLAKLTDKQLTSEWLKKNYPSFSAIAWRVFGSFSNLMKESDLDCTPPQKWTEEGLEHGIRELADKSLTYARQHASDLLQTAIRYYGSWEAALSYYGYDYSKIVRKRVRWTHEEIGEELRKLHRQHGTLTFNLVQNEFASLLGVIRGGKQFRNVEHACKACNVPYKRINTRWSKKKIKSEYLKLLKAYNHTPTITELKASNIALQGAMVRHFGGYKSFMETL